jgi:hypothetical protein
MSNKNSKFWLTIPTHLTAVVLVGQKGSGSAVRQPAPLMMPYAGQALLKENRR